MNPMKRTAPFPEPRGVSLIFTLLALVALSLAAMALIRSSDTGTMILGNIGFRQEATSNAEQAIDTAVAWLNTATSLDSDVGSRGYYASSHDSSETLDVTGMQSTTTGRTIVGWDGDCAASSGTCLTPYVAQGSSGAGQASQQYVIFRLCTSTGATTATGNACLKPVSDSSGATAQSGSLDYGTYDRLSVSSGAYYRIVVRVKSAARDTTSFVEAIVHL